MWVFITADMVELVDTQDLESCEATRAGSIPVIRTILKKHEEYALIRVFSFI